MQRRNSERSIMSKIASRKKKRIPPQIVARGSSHPKTIFNLPPKKIIKAAEDYQSKNTGILSFKAGDFFYVINDNRTDGLVEVTNPVLKIRGLVPIDSFSDIKKTVEKSPAQRELQDFNNSAQNRYEREKDVEYDHSKSKQPLDSIYQQDYDYRSGRNQVYSKNENEYGVGKFNSVYTDYPDHDARSTQENDYSNFPRTPQKSDRFSPIPNKYRETLENEYNYEQERYGYSDDDTELLNYNFSEHEDFEDGPDPFDMLTTNRAEKSATQTKRGGINNSPLEISNVDIFGCEPIGRRWIYTLNVKYNDNHMNALKRTHEELWDMHITLVREFPDEAGRQGQPRLIPFLIQPSNMDFQLAQRNRMDLTRYFNQLLETSDDLLNSGVVNQFFSIRDDDEEDADISFDVADTLLDILDNIKITNELTLNLDTGKELISWEESADINIDELFYAVDEELGYQAENLYYEDELGNEILLFDDDDFNLLKAKKIIQLFVE